MVYKLIQFKNKFKFEGSVSFLVELKNESALEKLVNLYFHFEIT